MRTEAGTVILPSTVPCTDDALEQSGVYIVDNGEVLYLYVGEECSDDTLYNVNFPLQIQIFAVENYDQLYESYELPNLEGDDYLYNTRVNAVIEEIRRIKNGKYPAMVIIIEG